MTGAPVTRIALLQMNAGVDPAANAATIVKAIADAKAGGAAMLFTPEMSNLLDRDRVRAAASLTVERDDDVLDQVRDAAKACGIWVDLGSFAFDCDDGSGQRCNRALVIDDRGEIRARYDKIHLFDVDLESGESWRESSVFRGGDEAVLVKTPCGQLGLSICYDIRFSALYEKLSGAGAEMISIPAAFTVSTGEAHWHILLRARAIESACFVVAAAQTGSHEDGRKTYGHSLVVDPWGEVLLDMEEAPGLGFADIDMGMVAKVRSRIPAIANRRPIARVNKVDVSR